MKVREFTIWSYLKKWYGDSSFDIFRNWVRQGKTDEWISKLHPTLPIHIITIMRLSVEFFELEAFYKIKSEGIEGIRPGDKQHRGRYSVKNEDGKYNQYKKNDIVEYENRTFMATKDIEIGFGPLHTAAGWEVVTPDTIDGAKFK